MDKHIPCHKCGHEVLVTALNCDKCGYEIEFMDIFVHQIKQTEEEGSKTKKDSLQLSDKFWQKVQDILRFIKRY